MNKIAFVIILLVQIEFVVAQNMVLNGSFEISNSSKFGHLKNISKCVRADTPDYFSDTYENLRFNKYRGNIKSKDGTAHIGIYVYRNNLKKKQKPLREFVQLELNKKMEKDSAYLIKFNISLDCESNILISSVGAFFSEIQLRKKTTKEMLTFMPQFSNEEYNYPKTEGWTEVSGIYRAKGGEKFVTLGNFKPDEYILDMPLNGCSDKTKLNKWNLEEEERIAYLFLDNVSVTPYKLTTQMSVVECEKQGDERLVRETEKISDSTTLNEEHKIISKSNNDLLINEIELKKIRIFSEAKLNYIKIGQVFILRNIQFDFDKIDFTEASMNELNNLLLFMRKDTSVVIEIRGHTDSIGDYSYNVNLSLKRAQAVRNFLIENGISKERMCCFGYGSAKPIATNETDDGRGMNRRVEFIRREKR